MYLGFLFFCVYCVRIQKPLTRTMAKNIIIFNSNSSTMCVER